MALTGDGITGENSDVLDRRGILNTDTLVQNHVLARFFRVSQIPRCQDLISAIRWVSAAIILSVLLYVVLRPENYGLTPNSLDPLFYSGYAINFDDIMYAVSDRHYFVSRWTSYYPGYLADIVAGPSVGRLLLRLVYAVGILGALWGLGRRQSWSWAQRFLIGSLVLTMPMFLRAFFTDYVEHVVVALGLCLLPLCLSVKQSIATATLAGVIGGAMVVANPIAVTAVGLPLLICCLLGATGWLRRGVLAISVVGGATLVIAGGFFLFRWRYGIQNVYQPSINFARTYEGRDAFKSPRLEWVWHFTWIYATPIVIASAVGIALINKVRFERYELVVFFSCCLQYIYQWIDQFVRDGNGLEVAYYWSFAYPSFALALAILVGRFTSTTGARYVIGMGLGWILLLVIGVPDSLRFPAGIWFFALASIGTIAIVLLSLRTRSGAMSLLLATICWTQTGAPIYDPSSYFNINVSPRYDLIVRQGGSLSEIIYQEAMWFEKAMDRIPNDSSTSFVSVGGWSSSIVGIYAPHVVGRMVAVEADQDRLTPLAVSEILSGTRPIVAVFGPPERVADMVGSFYSALGTGERLLDVTHDRALGYRLVVYSMPDSATLPFTWPARALPRASGDVVASSVTVGPGDALGFVTFGPYVRFPPGSYEVVLKYSSSAAGDQVVGAFDISSLGGTTVAEAQIRGTSGRSGTAKLGFEVVDATTSWEFRTSWYGSNPLVIESISALPG